MQTSSWASTWSTCWMSGKMFKQFFFYCGEWGAWQIQWMKRENFKEPAVLVPLIFSLDKLSASLEFPFHQNFFPRRDMQTFICNYNSWNDKSQIYRSDVVVLRLFGHYRTIWLNQFPPLSTLLSIFMINLSINLFSRLCCICSYLSNSRKA